MAVLLFFTAARGLAYPPFLAVCNVMISLFSSHATLVIQMRRRPGKICSNPPCVFHADLTFASEQKMHLPKDDSSLPF